MNFDIVAGTKETTVEITATTPQEGYELGLLEQDLRQAGAQVAGNLETTLSDTLSSVAYGNAHLAIPKPGPSIRLTLKKGDIGDGAYPPPTHEETPQ